jgi:signal transduction histidine kinase
VRFPSKSTTGYVLLLAGAFLAALAGSRIFGGPLERDAYDEMFRLYRPASWQPESALLIIDERSLGSIPGGAAGIRVPLAHALRIVCAAQPKLVAIDLILADRKDPAADRDLAAALTACPKVVLSSQLYPDGSGWEDPLPEFRAAAAAIGHVHAAPDHDAVVRAITLARRNEKGVDRRWAISLEAFRLSRNAEIVEAYGSHSLDVGGATIPATDAGRLIRVRFPPPDRNVPSLSLNHLLAEPSKASIFAGKVVFAGVTAQTEHDRLFTPYSEGIPTSGIEINADAFETMAHGLYITDVPAVWVALFALLLVASAGAAFRWLPGWRAYVVGALLIVAASAAPYLAFTRGRVFSFTTSVSAAWLGGITAAAYYHLVTRKNLKRSEAERARYQQAMHFVTHEMRTPLSAIQGSSELISRFALTEEKRKQMALLINSESKRLARMVEIFLNVERLSAGQMELKRESIPVAEMVGICIERVRPLAERKHIGISLQPIAPELIVTGDRELMEYACYNLLTNAVKYSPQRTEVTVTGVKDGTHVRIAVKDQGIGMDHKEVKQIFRKFYRTRKAEESGEAGTGIGLSIVQQIVEQHGGEIEVTSQPGAGSCFTLVLPASALASTGAERH